jgi:hypothetical protein
MRKIKLALYGKSASQRIAQGKAIQSAMTGNSDFLSPTPPLATVDAKTTALQAKLVARDLAVAAAKMATEELHTAMADYDQTMTLLAAYAQLVTSGDAAKLERGGFQLQAEGTQVRELGQVKELRVITNGYPGRFAAQWGPLHGAKSYEVQLSPEPVTEASWRTIKVSPASKTVMDELPSGQRLALRVRGVAKNFAGQWSEPVAKIVP